MNFAMVLCLAPLLLQKGIMHFSTHNYTDIVVMTDNLDRISSTLMLCRLAKACIVQNCVFAICVKLAAVALAVAGKWYCDST